MPVTKPTPASLGLGVLLMLLAAPVLARPAPNAAALDDHYASLETKDTAACFEFDTMDAPTRQKHCEKALEQLAKARKSKRDPSIGETANFEYRQVSLQAGLSAAYAEQDKRVSERSCKLVESSAAIRVRLKAIAESDLSESAYDVYQNPPANFAKVIEMCRSQFGTPAGATPVAGT
jgi:hypothetical protein